jgi:hypothetical protein
MTGTMINHRIGCAGGADGAINDPNMFTLRDAATLYEEIATGLLDTAHRNTLYQLMLDEEEDGLASLSTIINEEAAAAGFNARMRDAFRERTSYVRKHGNYGLCPSTCTYTQTRGGMISLPLLVGDCRWVERSYFVGTFVNFASNDSNASNAVTNAFNVLSRDRVRAAMDTWELCGCDWNFDAATNSQDYFDFLTDFFAGDADYNGDDTTNSQDFFDFLTCFFNA